MKQIILKYKTKLIPNNKFPAFSKAMPIVLLFLMTGCASVISKQIREQVRPDLTFREVLNDPERYKGQMIIVSGVVLETENIQEGTLLKVLQHPTGFRGKPKDINESEGRFLALDSHYLDKEVFAKGRSVTIAGEIAGKKILPMEGVEYTYPLIMVKEIYLWPIEKKYYTPHPYPYYYHDNYWRWKSRFRRHRCSQETFSTI